MRVKQFLEGNISFKELMEAGSISGYFKEAFGDDLARERLIDPVIETLERAANQPSQEFVREARKALDSVINLMGQVPDVEDVLAPDNIFPEGIVQDALDRIDKFDKTRSRSDLASASERLMDIVDMLESVK